VIDSNDLSPIGEAESLWLRALAFPPRPVDLTLQAVCWVSSTCFITSAIKAGLTLTLPVVGGILLVIVLPAGLAGLYAFVTFHGLQPLLSIVCYSLRSAAWWGCIYELTCIPPSLKNESASTAMPPWSPGASPPLRLAAWRWVPCPIALPVGDCPSRVSPGADLLAKPLRKIVIDSERRANDRSRHQPESLAGLATREHEAHGTSHAHARRSGCRRVNHPLRLESTEARVQPHPPHGSLWFRERHQRSDDLNSVWG
jgi:hypothetical protein